MSDLQVYKAALLSKLSDNYEDFNWTDAELEESLRLALEFYAPYGLPRESSFTVVTAGRDQDLSSLATSLILAIAWPWADGYLFEESVKTFRYVGESTVRFDTIELSVDEVLRVRYRVVHTISGLDAATSTTLWGIEEERFLLAAGSKAFHIRGRRMLQQGEEIDFIKRVNYEAEELLRDFYYYQDREKSYLEWGRMGL